MDNVLKINVTFNKKKINIKIIVILIIIIGSIIFLGSIIEIKEINIEGMQYFDKKDIVNYVKKRKSNKLIFFLNNDISKALLLRSGELEDEIIKKYSYVDKVEARFKIPDSIVIKIKEREPIGHISYYNSSLIIDKNGFVIGVNNKRIIENFPSFVGIEIKRYKLGERLEVEKVEELIKIVDIMHALNEIDKNKKKKLINNIQYIDLSHDKVIFLKINKKIDANIGSINDVEYKLNVLKTILDKHIDEDQKGTIDFTIDKKPVFVPK